MNCLTGNTVICTSVFVNNVSYQVTVTSRHDTARLSIELQTLDVHVAYVSWLLPYRTKKIMSSLQFVRLQNDTEMMDVLLANFTGLTDLLSDCWTLVFRFWATSIQPAENWPHIAEILDSLSYLCAPP